MGKPLGIPLGINFEALDRDLNKVADRIESVGKSAALKLGAGGGGGVEPVNTDAMTSALSQLGPRLGQLGIQISQGIATGIRSASASMQQFTSQITPMMDRMVGSVITMFHRIDAAIKFPAWDAFWRGASVKLGSFAAFASKPMSDLDLAMTGAFGAVIAKIARMFKVLMDELGKTISEGIRNAVGKGEASVAGLMGTVAKKASPDRFPMGGAGIRTSIGGPRIGSGTEMTKPVVMPKLMYGHELKAIEGETKDFVRGLRIGAQALLALPAGFLAVGAAAVNAYQRTSNFLSSLGSSTRKTYSDMYAGEKTAAAGATQLQAALAKTDAQVKTIGGSASTMGSRFTAAGGQLLAAFGVIGVLYKVVQFFKDSVKGAADLSDAVTVSKGIFGDAFGGISAQADEVSKKYGIMRSEQIKVASGFGAMAQGAKLTEGASAGLANSMTMLTLNFAAEWQMPFTEASDKIKAGLAGQAKGLKQYGVWLDDATVKNYAVAHGARLFGGELSKHDAVLARAAIITRGLSYTMGALDRTSGGATAQFRKAGGGIGEFGVRIGELVMPAVQAAIRGFNEFLATIIGVVEYASPAINGFARFVAAGWTIITDVAGRLGAVLKTSVGNVVTGMIPSIGSWGATFSKALATVELMAANMPIVWEIIQLKFGAFVENSIRRLGAFRENFGRVTGWLVENWANLFRDMMMVAAISTANLVDNITGFASALWKAVNSTWFLDNWGNMLTDMGTMISTSFTNILGNAGKFGQALMSAIKGEGFKHDAFAGVLDGFKATTEKMPDVLANNFHWTPLLNDFKATTDKLPDMIGPDLINVDDKVNELFGKMKMPGEAPGGPKRPPGFGDEEKKPDYKLASATEIGSKEASSILAKSAALARGGDTGMKTVGLLGQSVAVQRDLLAEAKKKGPALKVI